MHLRALYLSVLLCAGAAAAACWLARPAALAAFGPGSATVLLRTPLMARWTLYRRGAAQRVARLLPLVLAGGVAGVLLVVAAALRGRPQRVGAPRAYANPCRLPRAAATPEANALHPVEREAFAWLAAHAEVPADPYAAQSESLYVCAAGERRAAAQAFGAGTLESQLSVLRHLGKLLACTRDPGRSSGYAFASDPRPLAPHALRRLSSFHAMPDADRRELMLALSALQSGWIPVDPPPRVALALERLGAGGRREIPVP